MRVEELTGFQPGGVCPFGINDGIDVKTRTVYRYRDKIRIPVYYYYGWSDWSDWSLNRTDESDTMRVETRTVYRYADPVKE